MTLRERLSWRGGHSDGPPNVESHYGPASADPGTNKVDEIGVVSID